jgi:hypothetical protein
MIGHEANEIKTLPTATQHLSSNAGEPQTIAKLCGNIVDRVAELDLPISLDVGMLRSAVRKHGDCVANEKVTRLAAHLEKVVGAHDGTCFCTDILAAVASLTYAIPESAKDQPACPTCWKTGFTPIVGTDKHRCLHCGWLVRFEDGRAVDAVNWRTAGRSKKTRGRK